MKAPLSPGLALFCAILLAGPAALAAEPTRPSLSPTQVQGVAELARCQRAVYLNRIGRERLSEFLSGNEALRNIEDMARMQEFNRTLDAWFSELAEYFGADQLLPLMPPDRPGDKAFLENERSTEAESRAMVSATARDANVCLSNEEKLRKALAAP